MVNVADKLIVLRSTLFENDAVARVEMDDQPKIECSRDHDCGRRAQGTARQYSGSAGVPRTIGGREQRSLTGML